MALINCELIAKKILSDVKGGTLVVLRNNTDPSAISYVRQLIKLSQKTQTEIIEEDYSSTWLADGVIRLIETHNGDPDVSGIIVVSPEPFHYEALDHIHPSKRIEGTDFDDNPERVSCTARACVHIAETVIDLEGKNALIVGYGKAVGKPLSYLLMRKHLASVTITHSYTPLMDIYNKHIPEADIIFSAVGSKHLINETALCRNDSYSGKIFIDAGISIHEGRVWGDVNPNLAEKNEITPVPGGVGPVTTALLLKNVSLAAKGEF